MLMIECRNIAKGKGKGELIVSSEPISFLGGVNPENGEVVKTGGNDCFGCRDDVGDF